MPNEMGPIIVNEHTTDPGALVAIETIDAFRSSRWTGIQKAHLLKHPHCAACKKGITIGEMQVHHIIPYHYCVELGRADLELDARNLITLCADANGYQHHILLGHLGDWQSYNPNIAKDAKTFKGKTHAQLLASKSWNKKRLNKPPHLLLMTALQKQELKRWMDEVYPV